LQRPGASEKGLVPLAVCLVVSVKKSSEYRHLSGLSVSIAGDGSSYGLSLRSLNGLLSVLVMQYLSGMMTQWNYTIKEGDNV